MIDLHCHILPAIDDGSQNIDNSLELARQCVKDGVTHVVCTPHGSSENLRIQLTRRDEALAQLRLKLQEENIDLTLLPGLEYFADGHSIDAAMGSPSCLCGVPDFPSRPLLIELPFSLDLSFAANLLFKAQLKNITMILAHPERHNGFTEKLDLLKDLMSRGLYLQFNACDFKGSFFSHAIPKGILELMSCDMEHSLLGSDAHNPQHRPAGLTCARQKITNALGADAWKEITYDNPAKLLGLNK